MFACAHCDAELVLGRRQELGRVSESRPKKMDLKRVMHEVL